jgi:hypothetical protein
MTTTTATAAADARRFWSIVAQAADPAGMAFVAENWGAHFMRKAKAATDPAVKARYFFGGVAVCRMLKDSASVPGLLGVPSRNRELFARFQVFANGASYAEALALYDSEEMSEF